MGVIIPLTILPDITQGFMLTTEQVGWVTVAYTFSGIVMALITGVLADRFGKKAVLVPGIL